MLNLLVDTYNRLHRWKSAQKLLCRLLSALGPVTVNTMIEYLHCGPSILLADVGLLEMIATHLPNLARRIIQTLTDIVDDLTSGKPCFCEPLMWFDCPGSV